MNLNDSDFLSGNIKLLSSRYPGFKRDIIGKYAPAPGFEICDSASGHPTAKLDGSWIHSSRNPVLEAGKLVRSGIKSGGGICIIYGFGLGYHIEAVMEQHPGLDIIVVEPDPPLFLKALEARDFSQLIQSEKVGFLLDVKATAISGILSSFGRSSIQSLRLRALFERNSEYYQILDEEVKAFISKKETNMNTLTRFGKAWVRNLFRNVELFGKAGDAALWYNRFSDYPALVLAAGPSLDLILPELEELRKSYLIICVDTALRAVLSSGAVPDFVVVVDPQYLNTRHLDNCLNSERLKGKTVLISESSTHPAIFRSSKLPVFFFKSIFPLGKLLEQHAGISAELGAGGSVSTTAWDFALRLGCSEICTAGLDLSFPGGSTHCRESLSPFITMLRAHRLCPLDTINYHSVNNAEPFPADNNSGGTTITDRRLIIYKWWFEEQIKKQKSAGKSGVKLNTTSEDGLKIEGMELVGREALSGRPHRRGDIDLIKKSVTDSISAAENNGLELIKETVDSIVTECRRLENICSEALAILEKVEKAPDDPKLADSLARLTELDILISSSPSKELTGFIIQPVLNEIIDNDGPVLKNSRNLYENIAEACSYHGEHAAQTSIRLAGRA